jgi:hypothetical protein
MRRALELPYRHCKEGIQGVVRLMVAILFGAFYALVSATTAFAQEPSPLSLSASLSKTGSGLYAIEIQLKNTSDHAVTIQNLDLPWIPPNELIFVSKAYRMDRTRTSLEKFGPMADYMDVPHELEPGKSLTGHIVLQEMFPSLANDAKQFGVTIEWDCKSKRFEFRCKEGKRGKFVIAKRRTDQGRQDTSRTSPTPTPPQTK